MSLPMIWESAGQYRSNRSVIVREPDRGHVGRQRVVPDVHDVFRDRPAPGCPRLGLSGLTCRETEKSRRPLSIRAIISGRQTEGVTNSGFSSRCFLRTIGVLAEGEEVILLLQPFRRHGRMQRTMPVHQLGVGVVVVAVRAIPAGIGRLVDVAVRLARSNSSVEALAWRGSVVRVQALTEISSAFQALEEGLLHQVAEGAHVHDPRSGRRSRCAGCSRPGPCKRRRRRRATGDIGRRHRPIIFSKEWPMCGSPFG